MAIDIRRAALESLLLTYNISTAIYLCQPVLAFVEMTSLITFNLHKSFFTVISCISELLTAFFEWN